MANVTKRLVIRGRVQNVGFRYTMCDLATKAGLKGWVANGPDGATVEAVLQGDEAKVNELIEWAKKGPPAAKVDGVEISPGSGQYDDFLIEYKS